MSGTRTVRLALTPGEPAGIGPDITIMLAQQPHAAEVVAVADPDLLTARAAQLGLPLSLEDYTPSAPPKVQHPGRLKILPVKLRRPVVCGKLDRANAAYVLETLQLATLGCTRGEFNALVTGPVHKGVIDDAGIAFSGHTEFLAELTHAQAVMMLMTEGLRVALVTTHVPLQDISRAISAEHLEQVARILHRDLIRQLGLTAPRILVCGLNPHAGEGGHLGREEIETIIPVLDKLRREGMNFIGPLPADTLFTPDRLRQTDAVLAMYHDQGLPVLKYKGFGRAINITLGLPILRTSVDHGTALELAGSGLADASSLELAVQAAIDIAQRQTRLLPA